MAGFNYFDELRSGNTQQWISYLNGEYMNLVAPIIHVFKLDKVRTQIDTLHGDETFGIGRIYLPPYQMRAFHIDNTWKQVLGQDTMPYLETQEDIQFIVNFEQMVQKIRELKTRHTTNIYLEYSGTSEVSALKQNDHFIIKIDGNVLADYDLTDTNYNTTNKLVSTINSIPNFTATADGENDSSVSLVSFAEIRFKKSRLNIFSEDKTYVNSTDIIEAGDLILTHNWFLYEVLSNVPGGDFGWDYATMVFTCNLRSLDKAQLPNSYIDQIKRNEYGLRDKIKME